MPLTIPAPPPESVAAVDAAVPRIAASPGIAAQAPAVAAGAAIFMNRARTAAPQGGLATVSSRVYTLGLDAIVGGAGLSAATLVHWTHLLPSGGGRVVAADVTADTARFDGMTEGPQPDGVRRLIETLPADPAVAAGNYELAVLRVPALFVTAVWLRGQGGSADILVPADPTDPALTPGRHYSAADFLQALAPAAQSKLANSDPRKGG
ncbi:hypothetical protein [Roseicella frigidaeris]|uniref:Uncharacterized protein n=1 Tax=Roseicella frigidaeris TaxID=2230885 RepID=A0A327MF41_9PROT|nr:hypothetical protein [Roseicella frigidaeris]RAI60892.1 hypothetical protein DOO78_01820 [Roseicella frigidaeris]